MGKPVPVISDDNLMVTVYTKETRPTRLTIPTGSRISNVRGAVSGRDRAQVQADVMTIAAGSWEMHFAEPLPWNRVVMNIHHDDFYVICELRVDPHE